ncbi:MAG: C40 family peptidase [Clostridia bacterium]|nr:C40 family peptidase [Clostridia bacterium]
MKKVKTALALILSFTLLLPALACANNEEESHLSTPPSSEGSVGNGNVENSEENDFSQSDGDENGSSVETPSESEENEENENSAPPQNGTSSQPTQPSQPSQPVTPSTPSTPSTPTPTPSQNAKYIKFTGNNVNFRKGAGTEFSVLGQAEKDSVYAGIGKTGNWYKTYYRNQTAYVYASYAVAFNLEKSTEDEVEKVVSEGYKLLGVPYVYGAIRLHDGKGKLLAGFTAQKFDCSSLIQYVFYKGNGTILDVNTRTQVKQGKFVKRSDLQRGDCIFFTNEQRQNNVGIERVGHVAVYLGNDYILHTASDYARIEKMSAKRWSFYIEARRFL